MGLSANEFERVMQGPFWQEIEERLTEWVDDLRSMLEDPNSSAEMKDIHQIQGSLKAVRHVLALPQVILEEKQSEQQSTETETEDEEN